jgi:hypothetical protein
VRAVRDTAAVDEIARGEAVGSEDGTAGGKRGQDTVADRRGKAERDRAGQQREDLHFDSTGVCSAARKKGQLKTAWRSSALSVVQLRFVGKVIGP